jgi:cell wall-associated NlpC family hydrolase
VERSYGTSGGHPSALANSPAQRAAGRRHDDTNPSAGALVFYRNPYGGGHGHVEVSRGDGSFVSTGPTVQFVGFGHGGSRWRAGRE